MHVWYFVCVCSVYFLLLFLLQVFGGCSMNNVHRKYTAFDSPNKMIYLHGFQNPEEIVSFVDFSLFSWFFSSLVQHLRKTMRWNFSRVHLPSYIKYGTFTPLESTDYSNFFILFKQEKKENFFFSLFIVLYIWLLSSLCRKRRLWCNHTFSTKLLKEKKKKK